VPGKLGERKVGLSGREIETGVKKRTGRCWGRVQTKKRKHKRQQGKGAKSEVLGGLKGLKKKPFARGGVV